MKPPSYGTFWHASFQSAGYLLLALFFYGLMLSPHPAWSCFELPPVDYNFSSDPTPTCTMNFAGIKVNEAGGTVNLPYQWGRTSASIWDYGLELYLASMVPNVFTGNPESKWGDYDHAAVIHQDGSVFNDYFQDTVYLRTPGDVYSWAFDDYYGGWMFGPVISAPGQYSFYKVDDAYNFYANHPLIDEIDDGTVTANSSANIVALTLTPMGGDFIGNQWFLHPNTQFSASVLPICSPAGNFVDYSWTVSGSMSFYDPSKPNQRTRDAQSGADKTSVELIADNAGIGAVTCTASFHIFPEADPNENRDWFNMMAATAATSSAVVCIATISPDQTYNLSTHRYNSMTTLSATGSMLNIQGAITPTGQPSDSPLTYQWELAGGGSLLYPDQSNPGHHADAVGAGTLTLKALYKGQEVPSATTCTQIQVFESWLDMDRTVFTEDFRSDIFYMSSPRKNGKTILNSKEQNTDVLDQFNCHYSSSHAYNGSYKSPFNQDHPAFNWPLITSTTLSKGDVGYFTGEVNHSVTFIDGQSSWGANNDAADGNQKWKTTSLQSYLSFKRNEKKEQVIEKYYRNPKNR